MARATNNEKINQQKKILKMSNFKVLATTVLLTVAGVLIAMKINEQFAKAKVTTPTKAS